jgi:hypothetical protein
MTKLLLAALLISSFTACTHGSFASKKELDSARFARQDLCCAQTMHEINKNTYEAFGCGQAATYEYANKKWQRVGPIRAGSGDPADKLKDCSK